ncbi:MAG: cytochrome P450 [Alphaproteobacteria bacterium]|nr:cytochrome P450 [Alphaproteobacteria bacterium]MCB9931702.1 cytochrome P450 [Alphaproteobacteria bacterium]
MSDTSRNENGCPVHDWANDYDVMDEGYTRDPGPIWQDLRGKCPIAHTTRWGGSWMPTRYADIQEMANMVPTFSSRSITVIPPDPVLREELIAELKAYGTENPPITADPPEHNPFKRLILPFFSPRAVAGYTAMTEDICKGLLDELEGRDTADAAVEYAQQIPPRVIAYILGIDIARAAEFTQWTQELLELGQTDPELRRAARAKIRTFFYEQIEARKKNPGDDVISKLLAAEVEGQKLSDHTVAGMCNLLLVAGIDTTWSSIGSALYHFSTHPEDRKRLVAEPDLLPVAVEEVLRYYSPVTMARKVTEEVSLHGADMKPGDKLLMTFPAANRDPDVFEQPEEFVIDRQQNRHIAFGTGIHRCAGSNLARMELHVGLRLWFERYPEFSLVSEEGVTWAGGQVRGPRNVPVKLGA